MKIFKYSVTATTLGILVACGGGGSSVTNADPQGFWTGPSPAGYTVSTVILETGEAWGIYSSGSTVYGALYGNTTTNGNTATVTGTDFNFVAGTSTPGTLTGPITAKSSMTLSNVNGTIPLTYQSSYDTAASSAGPIGTWSFVGRSSHYSLIPASITINSSGNFTLSQTNCTTSGSIVPRPGGKNVYNLTLTSVGTGCAAGQSTLTGVTYLDTTVTPNRFLALGLTSNKSDGLIVIGTKQ
jgi:hypothetical protein